MARLGLDVDRVTAAGKELQARAGELDVIVGKIEGIVRGLPGVWDGPDAQQFVNEWWPEHKKTLQAASSHVAGLGRSALNNASEQSDVSKTYNGSGGTPLATPTPTLPVEPGGVATEPGAASTGSEAVASHFQDWRKQHGDGTRLDYNNNGYLQCVELANGYSESMFPGHSKSELLGDPASAKDLYASANSQYFDKVPGPPQVGDLIVIGQNSYSADGHVAIVESTDPLRVVQQSGAPEHQARGTFTSGVSGTEMNALVGYLRPKR